MHCIHVGVMLICIGGGCLERACCLFNDLELDWMDRSRTSLPQWSKIISGHENDLISDLKWVISKKVRTSPSPSDPIYTKELHTYSKMRPIYNAPSTKPKKAPQNPNASGYTLPLHMQHCVNMSSQQRLVLCWQNYWTITGKSLT